MKRRLFLVVAIAAALMLLSTSVALAQGPPPDVCDMLAEIGKIPDGVLATICGG